VLTLPEVLTQLNIIVQLNLLVWRILYGSRNSERLYC